MFQAAFYKGKGNFFNKIIRFWDRGLYSHSELVFSDGLSVSASYQDGKQVRGKKIEFNPEHWDFVELPPELEKKAIEFFIKTNGAPYDLFGQLRFVIFAPHNGSNKGYWCSEWMAAALGIHDPWRYSPNLLHSALTKYQQE